MKSSKARSRTTTQSASSQGGEDRMSQIARAAYFRAEARGFEPGYELEDWLVAEKDMEGRLTTGKKV
jgi:hypothetical protein